MATVELSAELTRLKVAMLSDLKVRRTNVLTKCMFGLYKTFTASPASAQTFMSQMELESDFYGLRIGVPNIHTAAISNVKVSVCAFAQFAAAPDGSSNYVFDANPTGGTGWHNLTFNGATTATLPAQIAANVASITYFDFIGLHSVLRTNASNATTRPLLAIKIEYPSGAVVTVPANDVYRWRTEGQVHRPLRTGYQAVAGITTPSSFTQDHTTDTNVVVPIVQYYSKKAGLQVMCSGDSTTEGSNGEATAFGAVPTACMTLSTVDAPVEYYNAGMHGTPSDTYGTGALSYLDTVRPHLFFYQPWTINGVSDSSSGGPSTSQMETSYLYLTRVVHLAQRLGARVYLLQGLPVNPGFKNMGSYDAIRRTYNTEMAAMTGVQVVVDYTVPMTGTRDANGQDNIPDGSSVDNAHPTAAKYTEMAAKIIPYISAA